MSGYTAESRPPPGPRHDRHVLYSNHLRNLLDGKLTIIWQGNPIHSYTEQEYKDAHAMQDALFHLGPYATGSPKPPMTPAGAALSLDVDLAPAIETVPAVIPTGETTLDRAGEKPLIKAATPGEPAA